MLVNLSKEKQEIGALSLLYACLCKRALYGCHGKVHDIYIPIRLERTA